MIPEHINIVKKYVVYYSWYGRPYESSNREFDNLDEAIEYSYTDMKNWKDVAAICIIDITTATVVYEVKK